eukprot:Amastigsp_a688694_16.p2 type:complete len:141 gc:universal Amastigsp_a688694_16:65-487(+)
MARRCRQERHAGNCSAPSMRLSQKTPRLKWKRKTKRLREPHQTSRQTSAVSARSESLRRHFGMREQRSPRPLPTQRRSATRSPRQTPSSRKELESSRPKQKRSQRLSSPKASTQSRCKHLKAQPKSRRGFAQSSRHGSPP